MHPSHHDFGTAAPTISREGMTDCLFVRSWNYEEQTDACEIVLRDAGGVLVVGPTGIDVYASVREFSDGYQPSRSFELDGTRDNWCPVFWRCDQTGGMCMVDVVEFANGTALTINEECAVLHDRIPDWETCDGSDAIEAVYFDDYSEDL